MKQIPLLGAIRAMRSFYFGYIAFLIPLFLVHIGFSTIYVGIYALVATVASSVLVLLSGFLGDLYSRKKTLLIMSALPAFIFISFLVTRNFIIIFATSLLGITFSAIGGGAGGGPIAPILTAFVADKTVPGNRTRIYSLLMIVSIVSAIGGSSTSAVLEKYIPNYFQVLFILALVLNISSIVLTMFLEDTKMEKRESRAPIMPTESSSNIMKIALSGAFGSVGLGIITPIISLYFKDIGLEAYMISIIFTASYIAAGVAVFFASYMERIFGSIYAIGIFRTLGSGLFIIIPFVPPITAGIIYALRTGFYQLALPIRQSFQMELLKPEERARGNSLTGIARRLPYGASTTLGSVLLSTGYIVFMFSFAGVVSILDPVLYVFFFRKYNRMRSREEVNMVEEGHE